MVTLKDARYSYRANQLTLAPPTLEEVKAEIICDRLSGAINAETCSWALSEADKVFAQIEKRESKRSRK